MILIDKRDEVQTIVITLSEKQIYTTSSFILQLTNATSNEEFICLALDVSQAPWRYNTFCITLVEANPVGLNQELCLPLNGYYYYNIYEVLTPTLDITGKHKVETGKVLVIDADPTTTTFSPATDEYIIFQPETV